MIVKRALLLATAICLSGCVHWPGIDNHRPPYEPKVGLLGKSWDFPKAKVWSLAWFWSGVPPVTFEVQHTQDFAAWENYAWVTNSESVELFPAQGGMDYFRVRAWVPGVALPSEWARAQ